ncbi:MAG: hypothetical protein JNJ56_02995 [Ignavibacteria bacterium]|nr:hypothetical protein [Ignavibacteria bacterium]
MNTLKSIIPATAMLILSVLTGCSDQLVSTGELSSNTDSRQSSAIIDKSSVFHTVIRLKPSRSYRFNTSNTGFVKINSINAENLSLSPDEDKLVTECQDMAINGTDNDLNLDCKSKGLDLKEIEIVNTGSRMIDIDVKLTGTKNSHE